MYLVSFGVVGHYLKIFLELCGACVDARYVTSHKRRDEENSEEGGGGGSQEVTQK